MRCRPIFCPLGEHQFDIWFPWGVHHPPGSPCLFSLISKLGRLSSRPSSCSSSRPGVSFPYLVIRFHLVFMPSRLIRPSVSFPFLIRSSSCGFLGSRPMGAVGGAVGRVVAFSLIDELGRSRPVHIVVRLSHHPVMPLFSPRSSARLSHRLIAPVLILAMMRKPGSGNGGEASGDNR